jgi:hypothetical protein
MAKLWRQEVELLQNYGKHKAFTYTTTSSSAEDAVTLAMEEGNKISFVVELADAYIEFDGDASTSTMFIPQNEGYFDEGIWFNSRVSILRNPTGSTNARIRGIIWGR